MKRVLLSLTLAFSLTPSAQAITHPKPSACPSITAIQAVGVNQVKAPVADWIAFNIKNYYDTPEEWSFLIIVGEAKNETAAIAKANARIARLSQVEGPYFKADEWACFYTDEWEDIFAIAITPPDLTEVITRFRK